MSKSLRLGIDLDGVVANFTKGWMGFYNREFGANLTPSDSSRWHDLVNLTHFEDIDAFWRWSSDLEGRSVFWHLEPFDGAIEAVRDLAADGHEIVILTAKPDFARDDTYLWLDRHQVPASEIHILEDKWKVDCDIYLDDSPIVLPDLVKNRPDRVVCRFVRPWNRPVEGSIDVAGFDEFREIVTALT